MTYAEAKKAVAGKLIFGDPTQLAAIHWLREFEQLKHAVMNCPLGHHKTAPALNYEYGRGDLHCSCLNGLDAMMSDRAEEMYSELQKYLERKANSSGRI